MKEQIQEFFQNRTVQLLGALLFFGVVILLLTLGVNTNQQTTTTSTRASETTESVRISFDRSSISALPSEEVKLILNAQPSTGTQQIQGYRFVLEFNSDNMTIVDMKYRMGRPSVELGNHSGNLTKANQDGKLIIQGEIQTPIGATLDSATSKNLVELTVVASSAGRGGIKLEESAFNNVISIQNDGTLKPVPMVLGQEPDFTMERHSGDKRPEDVTIDLKTQMQGIQSGLNVVMPLHLTAIDPNGKRFGTILDMTNDINGVWSGRTTIPLMEGSSYKFLFQSNRHIATAICDEQPQEEEAGVYVCPESAALDITGTTLTLDTSNILMLTGDLPEQDGVIDAQDVTRIRSFIGRTDGEALYNADVNYDGIVDTQDHGLVITALEKYKSKDQTVLPIENETSGDETEEEFEETESEEETNEPLIEETDETDNEDQTATEEEDDLSDDSDEASDDTEETGDVDDIVDEFFNESDDEDSDSEQTNDTNDEDLNEDSDDSDTSDEAGSETDTDNADDSSNTTESNDGDGIDFDSLRDNIGEQVDDVTNSLDNEEN